MMINLEIMRYLLHCQETLHLQPADMRVLDYGCGNGETVLELRLAGYQAYGVDIDQNAIAEGQKALDAHGFDGKNTICLIDENNLIPFPDQFFQFITSREVIEHVKYLDKMTDELKRVSYPAGIGFHLYRPQYNFVEPHFYMPLVHWLPKNQIRKSAILFYALLNIGMHPPEIPGASARERANFLYNYSINQTFYRPYRTIGSAFRKSGFGISFPVTNHRKIEKSALLSRLSKLPIIKNLLTWFVLTYHNGYVFTQTPGSDGTMEKSFSIGSSKFELFT